MGNFIWSIIKPYKWWFLLMMQAPVITAFYTFANNYALKLLVDAFSISTDLPYRDISFPIILFVTAQILLDVSWRISNIAEWRAEPLARRSLLLKAYNYVQYHAYSYFQNTQSGTIISKLKGILDGYDSIFSNLHHLVGKNFCVVVVSIFVLAIINITIFIFMLAWCLLVFAILYPMALKLNYYSNAAAESKHDTMGLFADNITNIFSLFYFTKRNIELKRAEKFITEDYVPKQKALYRYDFIFNMVASVLYWFMLIAIFFFMIHLRRSGTISTGDFLFVMLTAISISFELWSFISGMCTFMKELGDFKSSFSILAMPQATLDPIDAHPISITKGEIEFNNVTFAYESKPVLEHLHLKIKAGEKVGIVGHSGAGKSTLISLLLKNFSPSQGSIVIDGQDIADSSADSLRSQITLIPQDIMLFHRSIGENIGYAKENASEEEIRKAADMANILEFIDTLPEKFSTMVGERGIKLSGGQRQRIAIARSFLKNSPIVLLDEATSSLDSLTEQQIQQSINHILEEKKATVIAIAHRLSTIRHMDRIVVMEGGKIIEEGNFDDLLNNENGYFKMLWDSQVNGMVS